MSGALHYLASLGEPNITTVTLTVTITPTFVSGQGQGFTPCGTPNPTQIATAAASGGTPPYTYQWSLISPPATSGPWLPSDPLQASTLWRSPGQVCGNDAEFKETWRCLVTDADGNTGENTVDVQLVWIDLS